MSFTGRADPDAATASRYQLLELPFAFSSAHKEVVLCSTVNVRKREMYTGDKAGIIKAWDYESFVYRFQIGGKTLTDGHSGTEGHKGWVTALEYSEKMGVSRSPNTSPSKTSLDAYSLILRRHVLNDTPFHLQSAILTHHLWALNNRYSSLPQQTVKSWYGLSGGTSLNRHASPCSPPPSFQSSLSQ